jgi:hypothetical protein
MTFREAINEVLIRLREETIATDWSGNINDSSTVTDYQKVIGSLINDSKRNTESYHDWLVLRETKDITTVAGTRNYSLASGQEIKIIDVINQSTGNNLVQVSRQYINSTLYPSENSGEPLYYAFNGADSANNLKVDLEPKPDLVQTLSFDIVKYQDELKAASTVLKVPDKPVILGAWARAIAERGEDGGTQTGVVAAEVSESLNQAIMLDSGNTQYESDWYVN